MSFPLIFPVSGWSSFPFIFQSRRFYGLAAEFAVVVADAFVFLWSVKSHHGSSYFTWIDLLKSMWAGAYGCPSLTLRHMHSNSVCPRRLQLMQEAVKSPLISILAFSRMKLFHSELTSFHTWGPPYCSWDNGLGQVYWFGIDHAHFHGSLHEFGFPFPEYSGKCRRTWRHQKPQQLEEEEARDISWRTAYCGGVLMAIGL